MFLSVDMYPDPGLLASETMDQMKRFILFRFFCGEKVQFLLSRKYYRKFQALLVNVLSHVDVTLFFTSHVNLDPRFSPLPQGVRASVVTAGHVILVRRKRR